MEAARTSETLVNFYQTTRCYNPEDSNLHTHRRENLKSYYIECCYQRRIPFYDTEPSGRSYFGIIPAREHNTVKAYRGHNGQVKCILDPNSRRNWVLSLMLRPCYSRKRVPGINSIGTWVGPRCGGKEKSHYSFQESSIGLSHHNQWL
jgi:hypothetical protein